MYLSKSKYCNAIQCYKRLWLDEYGNIEKQDIKNSAILETGTEVGKIAKDLLGSHIDIAYCSDLTKMIESTKTALLNENVVITEASFSYQNQFCSVDLLKKTKNVFELYEVKSSTDIQDIYLNDIAYQVYILQHLGYKIKKANLVTINKNYIRKNTLELDKLFLIHDVTSQVFNKQLEVEETIHKLNQYMTKKEEEKKEVTPSCLSPYECPYFSYCTKNLPEKNVFTIRGLKTSKKFELYHQGHYSYQDLLNQNINNRYKQQIEFELYDKPPHIEQDKIKEFLQTLFYPLYFLDFETFQSEIPLYDNTKPYDQIPFQYSLHFIKNKKASLHHLEFLAPINEDPRRKLAEQLVKDIPKNACVIAYNCSFEKSVIYSLSRLYPDLKDSLLAIRENIKDIMIPFQKRYYYTKEMLGSYSIKYVLPALFLKEESLNYKNLDIIHNGSEAMDAWKNLKDKTKEEQQKIRTALLKYCELDTYAMVKILEKLQECIEEANTIKK